MLVSALRHGRNDGDGVFVENGIVQTVGVIGAIGEVNRPGIAGGPNS